MGRFTDEKDGKWITVKGRHIFIERGEELQSALNKIRGKVYFDVEQENSGFKEKKSEKLLTRAEKSDKVDSKDAEPYENIDSKVRDKLSSVRGAIKTYGKARTEIYTWDYCYSVEIYDDDEYSYEVLSRRKLK